MENLVQQAALVLGQVLPAAQQQPLFPFDDIAHLPPFAEELCPPHFVHRVVGVLDDVELVVYDAHCGAHSSILSRNGSHMSTQTASMRWRCPLLSCVRKYSSSVSFFRSFPNQSGSPVSRLLTTVRNLSFFPR